MKFKKSDVKIRKTWGEMNPVTRKVESRKSYSRKQKFNKNWQ